MGELKFYIVFTEVSQDNIWLVDYDELKSAMSKINYKDDGYLVIAVSYLVNDVDGSVASNINQLVEEFSELPFMFIGSNDKVTKEDIRNYLNSQVNECRNDLN
jgi:hypothetical protein